MRYKNLFQDEPPEMNNYHHHRSNENLVDLDHGDCSTESSSWSEVFCPKVQNVIFCFHLNVREVNNGLIYYRVIKRNSWKI